MRSDFVWRKRADPGRCVYDGEYYTINAGGYTAVFSLVDDEGTQLLSESKSMTVDSLAPLIEFNREPVQSQKNISIDYTVKDRAFNENDFTTCSGIKKIEFYDNEKLLDYVIPDTDSCIYSDEIILPLPTSDRIIIKAYDKMDHLASVQSPSFVIDNDNPEIVVESFKITREGVNLEDYISGEGFKGDISIIIKEQGFVSPSKTIADFTQLGGLPDTPASSCVKSFGDNFIAIDNPVNDPSIPNANTSAMTFDAGFGLFYHIPKKMYVGISTLHIPQTELKDVANGSGVGALNYAQARHYYIMAGYDWDIDGSGKWIIKPSILAKTDAASTQLDINTIVLYNNLLWGGVSYRVQDAIAILAGVDFTSINPSLQGLKFGVSYDVTTSVLGDYSTGSLEFMIKYCTNIVKPPKREVYHSVRFL